MAITLKTAAMKARETVNNTWQNVAAKVTADFASPALTGTPTAPTATTGTNTTQIATTAFVQSAIAAALNDILYDGSSTDL